MSDCQTFNNTQMVSAVPPPPVTCSGVYYIVQSGDSLSTIARRFVQMTVQDILVANPQITNPNIIYVGKIICIPHNVASLVDHPSLQTARPIGCSC